MKHFNKAKYDRLNENLVDNESNRGNSSSLSEWKCYYCDGYMKKGKTPPIASSNDMSTTQMPNELHGLNQLEQHLVSPVIPFMKVVNLPKGSQYGINGPIVCVSANNIQFTSSR